MTRTSQAQRIAIKRIPFQYLSILLFFWLFYWRFQGFPQSLKENAIGSLEHDKTTSIPIFPNNNKNKLHGLSLRANYTDRATAACRRSDC
jgi:hypothetical protein